MIILISSHFISYIFVYPHPTSIILGFVLVSFAYMYYIHMRTKLYNKAVLVLDLCWTYFMFIVLVIHKVVLHMIKRNILEHIINVSNTCYLCNILLCLALSQ